MVNPHKISTLISFINKHEKNSKLSEKLSSEVLVWAEILIKNFIPLIEEGKEISQVSELMHGIFDFIASVKFSDLDVKNQLLEVVSKILSQKEMSWVNKSTHSSVEIYYYLYSFYLSQIEDSDDLAHFHNVLKNTLLCVRLAGPQQSEEQAKAQANIPVSPPLPAHIQAISSIFLVI